MSLTETFFGGGVSPLAGLGVVLGSYFLGCFSTGYYLVRQRTGQDIPGAGEREHGGAQRGARAGPARVLVDDGGGSGKGGSRWGWRRR